MELRDIIDVILRHRKDLDKDKILELINLKIKSLGGLISEEAAAYIVARELGVKFYDGSLIRALEISPRDLDIGMKNVIVSGFVSKIEKEAKGIKIYLKGVKGGNAILLLKDAASLKRGDVIRIIGGYVHSFQNGVPILRLGKKGRILVNPGDLTSKVKREERNIEGVIVKMIMAGTINNKYCSILIIRDGEEYKELRISSNVRCRLERLKPGLVIKAKVRVSNRGTMYCDCDDLKIIGIKSETDPYYGRPLEVNEIRSGLRYVDVHGRVIFVGSIKSINVNGEDVSVRDVLLGGKNAIIRLRLWRELVKELRLEHKGLNVLVKNVNVRVSRSGLELSTSRYTKIIIL